MNLKELNSFKLSDAVTFHDKLNPKLWNGTKLRPEVRDQLLVIAQDFLQELGVHDLDVKDITISGSNAAYSYTKYSDLDLHILVDMGNLSVDEVYRELFTAKKTIYNDTHDITIHKIPVELYVQDSRQPVVSLGEYSVMNDDWIRIPTKRRSDFDQTATKSKYEKLLSLIEIALQSKKYSKVKHIIDTIKRYRQAGLDKGGEFGPENLAYKMLRSQGYITKLYELRDKLHSEKLSFETMYQNIDEESNHWYDAGVKDAQRDAKQYPDRVVKKLNPRTRLKTMQDKRARHPDEVEQYSLGYRGVKQGVAEGTSNNIPTIGINVRSDGNIDYASLIVDGKKKYESRRTDSLRPYVGKTVGIVRTGNGPAVAIGQVTIGEPIIVDVEKFNKLRNQHLVPQGSKFDIDSDSTKYLYPMIDPVRWDNEKTIKHRGIVSRKIQEQGVAEGEINDTAISLSKLGKFHPGADALAEFVPERASVQYALHPDKWESTFYSLTNKDSDKLRYYGPKKISIPPGTLVGDMAIANKFYRAKTSEEKQQYAEAYKASLQSYPVDVNQYRMPELLIPRQHVDEAFDTPLPITWEKGMHGDVDALAKLPDGSNLSIMFNKQDNINPDDKTWMVEFYRNNSQEVTGEGDAQKVFSTVLVAIQQFITKYKPLKIYFSASKEVEPGQNTESRAKLYDRLVLRYAKSLGYKFFRADYGFSVMYQLSRIPKQKAVDEDYTMQFAAEKTPPVSPYAGVKDNQYRGGISEASGKKISFKVQKGNGKFSTTLTVNNFPAGIYQYDSNTGRSIAEVYPEFKGKGLGKLLVLHAIYTAAKLGLDFQEDESRTAAYDNVLDSLSSNGYIVDDDGYWYVTGDGEQYLKQALNEASGYIPSKKQKNDPRFKTALTVDVHPDSIKKNAKAFYWNTSRAGIPPTAKTNGKIY
jgi:GNAT superfamily N-acetyltransferase